MTILPSPTAARPGIDNPTRHGRPGPDAAAPYRAPRTRTAWLFTSAVAAAALLPACAHRIGIGEPAPSAFARCCAADADALQTPRYEEEFLEARLVFQALPTSAPERSRLRAKLLFYLLDPLRKLSIADLNAQGLAGASGEDSVLSSLQEALQLFAPEELSAETVGPSSGSPVSRLSDGERTQLMTAAHLTRDVFAPRAAENEAALALAVLADIDHKNTGWKQQLDALLAWVEEGRAMATGESGLEGPPSVRQILEKVMEQWPSPTVAARLAHAYVDRQQRLSRLMRRPMGGGPQKGAFGEFLLRESDGLTSTAQSVAAVYLRAGRPDQAFHAVETMAGQPGDDAGLRTALAPFGKSSTPATVVFLKLARHFLPRVPLLDGTATEQVDPVAAMQVLRLALRHDPMDADTLVLASRVAGLVNAPLLRMRLLEEAEPALISRGADRSALEKHSRELFELAFALMRVHTDPENLAPAEKQAATLRKRLLDARARFGDKADWLSERPLELELARNYVDAGQAERAEPIYGKVDGDTSADVEVTLQAATLWQKSGDPARAIRLLRDALDRHKPENPPNETIGFVEGHSKLARALGQAYDTAGRPDEARESYRLALRGWERLMIEHIRRRSRNAAAEATFEVGRLVYLLGRRAEGIQKFNEGIALAEGRDQSYIDPLAFLVQRGEVDAVLDIFRAAISRPGQTVSEYVKVYASLWVQDLVRRSGRTPEPSAEAYLRFLANRKVHLRPMRAATWYVMLARLAVGQTSYDQLVPLATTTGRKAELYFYEAMRRLADGKVDDAHDLWTRVLQTKMFSFFEYDMATRYIHLGAPTAPSEKPSTSAETI